MVKKLISAALCAACLVSLCGCWDYSETSDQAIIAGFSLDRAENEKMLLVGMELLTMNGGSGEPVESKILKSQGHTVADALGNSTLAMSNHPYTGHCKIVVVSEEIAKEGIEDVLNLVMRDERFLMSMQILVAQDTEAVEVLESTPLLTTVVSNDLSKSLHLDKRNVGKASAIPIYEMFGRMHDPYCAYVLTTVKLAEQDGDTITHLSGGAVFLENKLVGYLDVDEMQEMLMASDNLSNGFITFNMDDGEFVTTRIESNRAEITPEFTPQGPRASLSIHCNLSADESSIDYSPELLRLLEEQIATRVQEMLAKTQEMGADIVGFSAAFAQEDHRQWAQVAEDWGTLYPELPVEIAVTVEIMDLGQFE